MTNLKPSWALRPPGDFSCASRLSASLLDAGQIDEFDIHVIPIFIGEGIPLMARSHRDVPLRLKSTEKYPDGVVRLQYEVA